MDDLLAALRAAVGSGHVLTAPDMRAGFETDWTRRYVGTALAVVRPGSTGEVAAVLRACARRGVAVVPQGGNTGLVGGGVPRGGEVVVSLTRLDAMSAVDEIAGEIDAGAGVTLSSLDRHAAEAGWQVPVDLAARDSATVGGMVATNAGGMHAFRHGSMRRHIAGVEAVMADGSVVRRMSGVQKDNAGYDLPGLLCGSEGTLAVITGVRVRLVPRLPHLVTALVGVRDVDEALDVFRVLRARAPSLQAAELIFDEGVDLVCGHGRLPRPLPSRHPAYLTVECAGTVDPSDELAAALRACGEQLLGATAVATAPGDRAALWAYRERHTEAINAIGIPHKLDVAVPLRTLPRFAREVRQVVVSVADGATLVLFGHVGDGNLHVNVVGPPPADDRVDDAVLSLAASLGGSISAEHGIGVAKRRWLSLVREPADIEAMRAIKAALDPRGTLNPGVLFDPLPVRP